jgi:hypothetical protein
LGKSVADLRNDLQDGEQRVEVLKI